MGEPKPRTTRSPSAGNGRLSLDKTPGLRVQTNECAARTEAAKTVIEEAERGEAGVSSAEETARPPGRPLLHRGRLAQGATAQPPPRLHAPEGRASTKLIQCANTCTSISWLSSRPGPRKPSRQWSGVASSCGVSTTSSRSARQQDDLQVVGGGRPDRECSGGGTNGGRERPSSDPPCQEVRD
jgi:hypothetical protein